MVLTLSLAAIALASLAGGILLWQQARQRAERTAATSFIQHQIEQRHYSTGGATQLELQKQHVWRAGPANWNTFLLRAGILPTAGFYVRLLGFPLLLATLAGLLSGVMAAGATLALAGMGCCVYLSTKADRRHRKAVEQLPDFLENMVRMMAIGNSLTAAFQTAAGRIDEPLLEIMQRANAASRSGQELDMALRQTGRQYGLHELYLVAAIIGVAIRFGGRSDHVLERMAGFMRDLTYARRELVALSAEVRLSAWVLALLPLGIAGFIIMFNNALFMGMWHDPAGWKLLIGAAALQIIGSYWLYRMARLA